MTARVLIFTGEGKGKTTAALGMVLRAAGNGLDVAVIQFIKSAGRTGELVACRQLPNVAIQQCGLGFVPKPSEVAYAAHQEAAEAGLALAREWIQRGTRMVVLDEVCTAVAKGLLKEDEVVAVIREASSEQVLVLTGRGATSGLIELADTVSEIRCVKHGLKSGLPAQAGVEF